MEQSTAKDSHGAARSVSRGLMRGLELGQVVPGQRLVETDLAARYGVGRNAVREAIQWLAAQGVIDVSRFRSPAIRVLGPDEALEVLDAAEAIVGLAARTAANAFDGESYRPLLDAALGELDSAEENEFARARRHFFRALLVIGGNRELTRLFRVSGLQIVYAQYREAGARRLCLPDLRAIAQAVGEGEGKRAEAAARRHIDNLRKTVSA